MNRTHLRSRLFSLVLLSGALSRVVSAPAERPPAVPLITHDPYFSVWSMNDKLTDGPTRHWTRSAQRLAGLVRIDGQVFRWMGDSPQSVPAINQTKLEVTPTRTTYTFEQKGMKIECGFLSPVLPSDMDLMSRPVSYITMSAASTDGAAHKVQFLMEVSSALAIDAQTQEVVWSRSRLKGITALRVDKPSLQEVYLELVGDRGMKV